MNSIESDVGYFEINAVFNWEQYEPAVERRDRFSFQKRNIPNFSERQFSFASLSERERNRTKPNEQPFRRLSKFSLNDT